MYTKIDTLRNLEHLIDYLEPFLPLANVHMVDYFTKNVFHTYIPLNMQCEIKKIGPVEVINKIFKSNYDDIPNLGYFAQKSKEFTLKNLDLCLKTSDLQQKFADLGCPDFINVKLNKFMTSKKSHEVEVLCYVAKALKSISQTSHLVDIGDGKGYLSSMIALQHKIPVLGVDSSETNTNGAVTRIKKLSRVWNSEMNKILDKSNIDTNIEIDQSSEKLYKQITKFVDESVDFADLVSNIFCEKPSGLGLVGLHTCGNLAPSSLKIFTCNENIKTICNVGCCYHLITENGEQPDNEESTNYGFPMSNFLKAKKLKIGRAARMIATQSVERILDKNQLPNETLFYRALLEVFLEKEFELVSAKDRQIGRFRRKPENFLDYVKKALIKLRFNNSLEDSEFEVLLDKYKERKYELFVFFLLRNMLSPIIECLILLDRLLYLQEKEFNNSFLVQLFDPVVSPRCYGLVSIK